MLQRAGEQEVKNRVSCNKVPAFPRTAAWGGSPSSLPGGSLRCLRDRCRTLELESKNRASCSEGACLPAHGRLGRLALFLARRVPALPSGLLSRPGAPARRILPSSLSDRPSAAAAPGSANAKTVFLATRSPVKDAIPRRGSFQDVSGAGDADSRVRFAPARLARSLLFVVARRKRATGAFAFGEQSRGSSPFA